MPGNLAQIRLDAAEVRGGITHALQSIRVWVGEDDPKYVHERLNATERFVQASLETYAFLESMVDQVSQQKYRIGPDGVP